MEKTISVKTHFVGTEQEAIEIANEWNELLSTNQFTARGTNEQGVYAIEGMVSTDDLTKFSIEQEFVVIG